MATKKRKTWAGRVYLGLDPDGGERYKWVGRFATKRERDAAVAVRRAEIQAQETEAARPAAERMTCGDYAARYLARYLARYEHEHKDSSLGMARYSLARFLATFGHRPLGSIARHEAIDWAKQVPPSSRPGVVTMFNRAVDEELLDRNPFRGLGRRTKGRSDENPPTEEEFNELLDSCSALGEYAPQMRALMTFAAYSGMRPGELFALEWTDVDLAANRVQVARRLYKGTIDLPKSNKERLIALTPPARDALLRLRALPGYSAEGPLVFRSKTGRQLSQPTLSGYWGKVRARAGLDFDFYLATKHYGVHLLYKLALSRRAIGAQMGWSEQAVEDLMTVYGHADLVALGEVDALYEKVALLRSVEVSDADSDAPTADSAF